MVCKKHVSQKAKFAHPKVDVGEYFMNSKNQYVKNKKRSIIQQVVNNVHLKQKCKICLACCNFLLLKQGQLMTNLKA
jgi:hypothetical protein